MKVRELIERLSKVDPEAQVLRYDDYDAGNFYEVESLLIGQVGVDADGDLVILDDDSTSGFGSSPKEFKRVKGQKTKVVVFGMS